MSALARWLASLLARVADGLDAVAPGLPLEPGRADATPEERLRDLRHRLTP